MSAKMKCKPVSMILAAILSLATVVPALAQDASGFLKDYSQLEMRKDAKGVERKVWISDKLTRQNYQKIMIDSLDFYPKPQSTDQVSMGALNDIRGYVDSGVRKAIGASLPVVSAEGPGVARLRWAITAASVDKSLKGYQLIPIALIFTAAQRGTGNASYDIKLMIESEMLDSVSGEVLARSVRVAKGVEVKGDAPLTLKIAQPQIDSWLAAVQDDVAARLGQPAK